MQVEEEYRNPLSRREYIPAKLNDKQNANSR